MTYPMHYTDNANSWRRMLMLTRFYWPGMKIGFIIVALVPVVFYFIGSALTKALPFQFLMAFLWPVGFVMYVAPVMLTKHDYRSISNQLPVTATEKMGFLLITFWLVVPGIMYLSQMIGNWLGSIAFGESVKDFTDAIIDQRLAEVPDGIVAQIQKYISNVWWVNMISFAANSIVIIYFVIVERTNRVLAGIASYFVVTIAISILTAAISVGLTIFFLDKGLSVSNIMDNIILYGAIAMLTILIGVGSIFFVKLYKRLQNSGF